MDLRPGSIEPRFNFDPQFGRSTTEVLTQSLERRISTAASGAVPPCRVIATSPITTNGIQTVDGLTVEIGWRVLRAGEADETLNGIWIVLDDNWQRSTDSLDPRTTGPILVTDGSANNAGSLWCLTITAAPVLGVDDVTFARAYADVPPSWVTTARLAALAVTLAKIDPTGAAAGNVITYNGTSLVWSTPASGSGAVVVRCLITFDFFGASQVPNGVPSSGNADGVALAGSEKVLVAIESDPSRNGLYIVSAGTWARSSDVIVPGLQVQVMAGGTAAGGGLYYCTNVTTPVIGTDDIRFQAPHAYDPTTAAELAGHETTVASSTVFGHVKVNGVTIGISSGVLHVVDGSLGNAKLADAPALSVKGNNDIAAGPVVDIPATGGSYGVLKEHESTLLFDVVVTENIGDGQVTAVKLEPNIAIPGMVLHGWDVKDSSIAPDDGAGLHTMDEQHPLCFVDTAQLLNTGVLVYTVYLPPSAGPGTIPTGATVRILDIGNLASVRNIVIDGNGATFRDGTSTTITIAINGDGAECVFDPNGRWQQYRLSHF